MRTSLCALVAILAACLWASTPAREPSAPVKTQAVETQAAESRAVDSPAAETAGEVVALSSQASHPLVLAGEERDVYLYLSLRAADVETPRLGLNLALVIDRSGSMADENKLLCAKAAAEQIVARLRPDDRLALVVYDTQVQTVVPSTPASETAPFLEAIRALRPGESTNLCGGMLAGYEEVARHLDETRLNRVVLLSDGLANSGVADRPSIEARAQECRARGVCVSTMGMGLQYDEDLMSGIAQRSGGNYYYVAHAEAVGKHLDHELDELGRVVARDLELRVELGDGVELGEVYGYPSSMDGRTLVVPVEDMLSAERKKVVVRLRVRGEANSERALATSALRYRPALERTPRTLAAAPLRVRFTDSAAEVEQAKDLAVLVKVEVVRNAAAMEQAMALQKAGDVDAAQELLAARYLNSKTQNAAEFHSEELTRMLSTMQQVLLDLERTRGDVRARRDLQLATDLKALGYGGGD